MELDVSGRPLALRELDLGRLFDPQVVAVVGASDTEGRPITAQWRRLRDWCTDRGAHVWPVHPTKAVIDGYSAVPTVLDVPADIDLVVILISDVETIIEQAIDKGVRFAIVFASGFAEIGGVGRARQERLAAVVRPSNLRLLGPNTNFNMFEEFRRDLDGPRIAMITQSGHQGRPIFQSQELGLAISGWAPTGNEVDLEFADFVRWFADQPDVGVIAAYLESFKDARTMRLAADHALQAGVPIVCVKVGRTAEGASMALSHTGKLTGTDDVVDATFEQHGVVRVDGLDQLIDTAQVFARHPAGPVRHGVAVYSISGGTGAHMADLCASAGLPLPTLAASTQQRLRAVIPDYLRVSNPVDTGGNGTGDARGRELLQALVDDPEVGVVICPITGAFAPMSDRLAQDLVDIAETTQKLICVVWGSPMGDEDAYRKTLLGSSKVATFRTFGNCVSAVKHWGDWHAFRATYQSPFPTAPAQPSSGASAARTLLTAGARSLTEHQAKEVLAAYGIPVTNERVVHSPAEAVRAADAIAGDGAVVLKVSSATVAHKTELGGVLLGVRGSDEVGRAYAQLAVLDQGEVLVAEQVVDGVAELLLGVSHDEVFGPVVTLGFGGVLAEIAPDVVRCVPPFLDTDVARMLGNLRGVAALRGARGRPLADEAAIIDAVLAVQRLALDLDDAVWELEINPLIVRPRGNGVIATDALIVRTE